MESLAALVAALLSMVIFSGPIGILLTLGPIWNMTLKAPALWYTRRILISLLALAGMILGFLILSSGIPVAAALLMISGMIMNLIAIKMEYQIGKVDRRSTPGKPGSSEF
jgi:hypothetical protein